MKPGINENIQVQRMASAYYAMKVKKVPLTFSQLKEAQRLLYEDLALHDPVEVLLTVRKHHRRLAKVSHL